MDEELMLILNKIPLTTFIAVISALATILYNILNLAQYFREKAVWDFYYMDDIARIHEKKGFNPEYLITSLFIILISSLFMLFIFYYEWITVSKLLGVWLDLLVMIFLVTFGLYYYYSYYDIKKGIRSKKEFLHFVILKSLLTTIKYSSMIMNLFVAILLLGSELNQCLKIMLLGVCLLVTGVFWVYFEYNHTKILTNQIKTYETLEINNETYCVISTIYRTDYLLVKCKIEESDENGEQRIIKLFLDTKKLIPVHGVLCTKKVYTRMERYYNDEAIKPAKWWYIG